jgi:hypothetical protein
VHAPHLSSNRRSRPRPERLVHGAVLSGATFSGGNL